MPTPEMNPEQKPSFTSAINATDLGPSGLDLDKAADTDAEPERVHDPHANDEWYQANELVERARELKLNALALAIHAGLVEEAGLAADLADAQANGIDIPEIPNSAIPATLAEIQAQNEQAEGLFQQGQALHAKINADLPKTAEEAQERQRAEQAE